jgi:hypothetical protein
MIHNEAKIAAVGIECHTGGLYRKLHVGMDDLLIEEFA